MKLYFCRQRLGNPAINFSLNLIYISDSSGKISLIFVVNKPWVHSYLNMVTARVHNSYKRLIQSKKFGDSIMTVTTSSHSKKKNIKITFYSWNDVYTNTFWQYFYKVWNFKIWGKCLSVLKNATQMLFKLEWGIFGYKI